MMIGWLLHIGELTIMPLETVRCNMFSLCGYLGT